MKKASESYFYIDNLLGHTNIEDWEILSEEDVEQDEKGRLRLSSIGSSKRGGYCLAYEIRKMSDVLKEFNVTKGLLYQANETINKLKNHIFKALSIINGDDE